MNAAGRDAARRWPVPDLACTRVGPDPNCPSAGRVARVGHFLPSLGGT